ncbi:hypothetical protein DFA_05006 [Cavenderia fasciculata]|uniref:Transmembrane protein n=1 Tax=Cavenderia fasciculata TaxID=261658 RepID=F4PMY3_CACFS|nr:uncharacterized protein DFA_05006 [Cavenderia fasciculata]EGG22876.1 hypothetical protein DFA_05006 [Cavenderia fasciculata]|eukprot:XP_004360727.1 hypothetical protein DFA_05006 [Cavenderia fasciculata]
MSFKYGYMNDRIEQFRVVSGLILFPLLIIQFFLAIIDLPEPIEYVHKDPIYTQKLYFVMETVSSSYLLNEEKYEQKYNSKLVETSESVKPNLSFNSLKLATTGLHDFEESPLCYRDGEYYNFCQTLSGSTNDYPGGFPIAPLYDPTIVIQQTISQNLQVNNQTVKFTTLFPVEKIPSTLR